MKKTEERRDELKNRLREAMSLRGMKAVELCERTGIPKGAISYYLAGKSNPKADRVHLLGKALEVSEAWLMGFEVPMERTAEQKKNDQLAELIVKMRRDPDFCATVLQLAELTPEQYQNIKGIIAALQQ